jgi:hypothetical protein
MTLQEEIEHFVDAWGPDFVAHNALRRTFINRLRRLLNLYAEAALKHGAIPEKGMPHRRLQDADIDEDCR